MKKKIFLFVISLLQFHVILGQTDKILWYKQPAVYFEESLVLGNGKMGASVFGGINSDKIFLNDATLWSGQPVNANMSPEAYKNLPALRAALKNEDYKLADELNKKLQGNYSESFAPLGTMYIDFKHGTNAQKYYRELNINDAISKVSYEIDGNVFSREYLISYPDQIMVIKLTSAKKGALNFDIKFKSELKYKLSNQNNLLKATGYAPIHTEPSYRGNIPNPIVFKENSGTRFTNLAKIVPVDGTIISTDSSLGLKDGTEAIIYVSIATSFNGYDKNPASEGLNDEKLATEKLVAASLKTFPQIKQSHLKDYQTFFNRVSLSLGKSDAPNLPTDERLKRYAEGEEDKNLEVLYFQYGRYLLISSSRTKNVPANLQGIWNPYIRPPWSSNYTTNINVEENYWLAENANLSEMHLPLMGLIENISKTGKITAKTFYGLEGWTACHNSDIWAMSNPVGDFGTGYPSWANWNMGGAWLSTHLWEHYTFTKDQAFLKNQAYEIMKGASVFCLGWLIEDKNGALITSPSTSPENVYVTPEGYHGATLYGGAADLAMIKELFESTIKASAILQTDVDFREKLKTALAKMYKYQVGKNGNLQEWYFDWQDEDPKHRHQSHLFGLFPGHQIDPKTTPQLADACRKTLEIKGDETTGWSKGWRINLWARLWDGNHAYKMYRELLHYVDPDGLRTNYSSGGGTYPNLFDAHPPFQIDGNFGGAAAVVEMLLQSSEKEIRLLPALPDVWETGAVKGICARGGFELELVWNNKTLQKTTIYSKKGGETTVIYGSKQQKVVLAKGEKKNLVW